MTLDEFKKKLCAESVGLDINDERVGFLVNYQSHQSVSFYSDLSHIIQKLYPCDAVINILDVGSRTGSGAEFLAMLFSHRSYSRIKASVTALDISSEFVEFSRAINCEIKDYIVGSVDDLSSKFDIVIASHTIEHVLDPENFIKSLIRRSSRYVIIACPFMEGAASLREEYKELIPGHINRIDYAFIEKFQPVYLNIYRSLVWHQSLACIFVIDVTKCS